METRRLVIAWAVLMGLLLTTVAASFVPLGAVKPAIGVGIAAVKAAIVGWVFMSLRSERPRTLVFALGGFVWLALLLFLAWGELATRGMFT